MRKRISNLRKHGIDFVDAIGVLEDPLALTKAQIEKVRNASLRWVLERSQEFYLWFMPKKTKT